MEPEKTQGCFFPILNVAGIKCSHKKLQQQCIKYPSPIERRLMSLSWKTGSSCMN
ncbi:hypothetical protein M8C21_009874 [Ambrosia artemisiifolia]|uniref:Uncharacterized protein n=1 Tax=Ambrosia artemisiifolia TaxID=4212 RepID=A0AAD5GXF7_AMBAR|nr:hypothetical protein M8C21_009874 [Ambrosia artemisiifolia]